MRRQHQDVIVKKTFTHEELEEIQASVVVEEQRFDQLQHDNATLSDVKTENERAIAKQSRILADIKQEIADSLNDRKDKIKELNDLHSKISDKVKNLSVIHSDTATAYRMVQVDHNRLLDTLKTTIAKAKVEHEELLGAIAHDQSLIGKLTVTLESLKADMVAVKKSIELSQGEFVQAQGRLAEVNRKTEVATDNLFAPQRDLEALREKIARGEEEYKELQKTLAAVQADINANIEKNKGILAEIDANALRFVNLGKREIEVDKKARRLIELYAKAGVTVEI